MPRRASLTLVACAVVVASVMLPAQSAKLRTSWAAPDAGPLDFAGKRVVAVAISRDLNLRMSAEEALAREITARGPVGVAAYRAIPAELLEDKDKAQEWFTKTAVAGVMTMRVVNVDKETTSSSMLWTSSYYQSFDTYYMNGWQTAAPMGPPRETTTLAVETLLYHIAGGGKLVWAGTSETTNPKNVGTFVQGLAKAIVADLQKKKLVKKK